ncbi:MAG: hypothetical protein AAF196_18580 [Planctomycetota bacterium]
MTSHTSTSKTTLWTVLGVLAAAVILTTVVLDQSTPVNSDESDSESSRPLATRPLAEQPRIVFARPFQVAKPFRHVWHHEEPLVDSGFLVVLDAGDRDLRPRQNKESVLQIGGCVVDRINTGEGSGHLVVIVPEVDSLFGKPAFFGKPDLPEQMTAQKRSDALAEAVQFGNVAAGETEIRATMVEGLLEVADDFELRLAAIDLVERFAPDEEALISGWRVPRVR